MNWHIVAVGFCLILLRILFPPTYETNVVSTSVSTALAVQIIELGIFTFALGYLTRPEESGDPLYFIRRHLQWRTEKYLLIGMGTLCVAILPVFLAPWLPTLGTPLSLMLILTFPVGSGCAIIYVLHQLITNWSASALLVLVPWIPVIVGPCLLQVLFALAAH